MLVCLAGLFAEQLPHPAYVSSLTIERCDRILVGGFVRFESNFPNTISEHLLARLLIKILGRQRDLEWLVRPGFVMNRVETASRR